MCVALLCACSMAAPVPVVQDTQGNTFSLSTVMEPLVSEAPTCDVVDPRLLPKYEDALVLPPPVQVWFYDDSTMYPRSTKRRWRLLAEFIDW